MTAVSQDTDFSCYLACLESFFKDADRTVTQESIIDSFPIECHRGLANEGEFDFNETNNTKLEEHYGIRIKSKPKPALFADLNHSDFIGAENMKGQGVHHIVRFESRICSDKIRVMDPRNGSFEDWTEADFNNYKCYVFSVSIRKQGSDNTSYHP